MASEPSYTTWIMLHLTICSVCGATVIDHQDVQAAHTAWHEQFDGVGR